MLLDTIATIILLGMMLVPFLNIIVGVVVGAGLASLPGALLGLVAAVAVMGAERLIAGRWRQPHAGAADALGDASSPSLAATGADLRSRLRIRVLAPRRRVRPPRVHIPQNAHTLH